MSKLLAFMVITVGWLAYAGAVTLFTIGVLNIDPHGHTNPYAVGGFLVLGCAAVAVFGLFLTESVWKETKK